MDNLVAIGKEVLKKKWLMPLIAAVGPIIFWGGLIIVAILLVLGPIMDTLEAIEDFYDGVVAFFSGGQGNGEDNNFMENMSFLGTDDEKVLEASAKLQEKAQKIYDEYNEKANAKIDMPLILSTIYYPIKTAYDEEAWNENNANENTSCSINSGNACDFISKNINRIEELAKKMITVTETTYSCKETGSYVNENNETEITYGPDTKISSKEVDVDNFPSNKVCLNAGDTYITYSYSVDEKKYDDFLVADYLKRSDVADIYDIPNDKLDDELYLRGLVEEIHDLANIVKIFFEENVGVGGYTGCSSCSYNMPGYRNGEDFYNFDEPLMITNLKVQLLECGNSGQPIAGEPLVDFEKYILGVVNAENHNGPEEALKAQAIAARSYSLTRPFIMGSSVGHSLSNENGEWILKIRNCTEDQVYCDPDKGCWSDSSDGSTTIYSGQKEGAVYSRAPLDVENNPSDALLKKVVPTVAGVVLADEEGRVVNAPYVAAVQTAWNEAANNGDDYAAILVNKYDGDNFNIQISPSNCSNTCDFAQWKQYDPLWKGTTLGGSTLGAIGCAATSVAIQIANSGVAVSISPFNPGTFVEKMNENGGFSGNNIIWAAPEKKPPENPMAPDFIYDGFRSISGTSSEKATQVQEHINDGCYLVMEVKERPGQHWVAIDYVSNGRIYMMDPGSKETDLWAQYPYTENLALHYLLICYKVKSGL